MEHRPDHSIQLEYFDSNDDRFSNLFNDKIIKKYGKPKHGEYWDRLEICLKEINEFCLVHDVIKIESNYGINSLFHDGTFSKAVSFNMKKPIFIVYYQVKSKRGNIV